MKVAVLTFQDFKELEIHQWIDIDKYDIHLYLDKDHQSLCTKKLLALGYKEVGYYKNYLHNGNIILDIIIENDKLPFDRIVYFGEDDVIRSSIIAEELELAGISQQAATAYRDKYEMKKILEGQGVDFLPKYRAVSSPLDIIQLQKELGYPIFIKPRTSAGSSFAQKIPNEQAMREIFTNHIVSRLESCEYQSDLIIEEYVTGQMVHVDGFIGKNGKIECLFPSRYLLENLELINVSEAPCLASAMLEDGKLKSELIEKTIEVIEGLPSVQNTPIHAEFFITPSGKVVFCEIAARTGGAGVNQAIKHATGIDLNKTSFLAQMGLPYDLNEKGHRLGGWSLFNPIGFRLDKQAEQLAFPFLAEITFYYQAGDCVSSQIFSSSKVAKAIATGSSEQEVTDKLMKGFNVFLDQSQAKKIDV